MMLRSPKTWTTVSSKPAALLVASSTEGSGGTSLGPVKKVAISTLLYAAETWVLYGKHIQLPPKLPVIHHGNTLAGLCHQRRSSREGWTAKYRDNAATSTSLLGRPCLTHERHSKLWSLTNSAKVGGTEVLHAGAKRTSWSDGWHRLVLITETHWRLH